MTKSEERYFLDNELKKGDIVLHFNNESYPFLVLEIDNTNNICKIVPLGNNAIKTVNNNNIMEISCGYLIKEFTISSFKINEDF